MDNEGCYGLSLNLYAGENEARRRQRIAEAIQRLQDFMVKRYAEPSLSGLVTITLEEGDC